MTVLEMPNELILYGSYLRTSKRVLSNYHRVARSARVVAHGDACAGRVELLLLTLFRAECLRGFVFDAADVVGEEDFRRRAGVVAVDV